MIEQRVIAIEATTSDAGTLKAVVKRLRTSGYQVEGLHHGLVYYAHVPFVDDAWEHILQDANTHNNAGISWQVDRIVQVYSTSEVETAPMFDPIHGGRTIEFPRGRDDISGVCHLAEFDDSTVCMECGTGVRQVSPMRVPAAELNKCGQIASIQLGANVFWMLAESLVGELEESCGARLPRRQVDGIGKAVSKSKWWQIVPDWSIPANVVEVHRYRRGPCLKCGAVRLDLAQQPYGGYFTVRRDDLKGLTLPPIMSDSFVGGNLERFPDGRIRGFPTTHMWLRGDVGRALAKKKIRGLDLYPIIWT